MNKPSVKKTLSGTKIQLDPHEKKTHQGNGRNSRPRGTRKPYRGQGK